jgi:hypothetical protein
MHIFMSVWWRGGFGRIIGGTRVLELAAESREVTQRYCARPTLTDMLTSSRPKGGSTTTMMRTVATGGAARYGGGGPHDPVRRV